MLHARWGALASGRVNPIVPAAVALFGFGWVLAQSRAVGAGIVIGALLAALNGTVLSKRVDFAALSGDIARALLAMQLSLIVTMTIIGIIIVILVKLSLAMAVAAAAGFAITQLGILLVFYWTRGRIASAERTTL